MTKPYSPKEFLKQRRPESFSDSEIVDTPILDRAMFEYFLDTLTSRSEEVPFEDFARSRHVTPPTNPRKSSRKVVRSCHDGRRRKVGC